MNVKDITQTVRTITIFILKYIECLKRKYKIGLHYLETITTWSDTHTNVESKLQKAKVPNGTIIQLKGPYLFSWKWEQEIFYGSSSKRKWF